MNIDVKGVHVEITEKIREYIDKKLHRLDFVSEHIIDLLLFVSQEGSQYSLEANINFRWGNSNHMRVKSFDIFEGVDKLFDKMELKVIKEKNKIQDHKGHESVRSAEAPNPEL
ncbi:MAG: ribosome-associated translation inhibitor RaiA [Spirochaetaceae bacterium]|nr:MAG: ribosome-associated translation inhibitor RaiA [Spirochaetaceae bacterium]